MISVRYSILIILIVCTFLVTTKLPIWPEKLGKLFSAVKDVSFFYIGFYFLIIKIKNARIRADVANLLILLFVGVTLFFTLISPLGPIAFLGFLGFVTAPLLYIFVSNMSFPLEATMRLIKTMYWLLVIVLFVGLLLHLFAYRAFVGFLRIGEYLEKSGIGWGNVIRYARDGRTSFRLLGLSVNPNENASLCIILCVLTPLVIKSKFTRLGLYVLFLTILYYTTQRAPIIGGVSATLLYWWIGRSPLFKAISAFFFVILIGLVVEIIYHHINLIIPYLDGSAIIHLINLFFEAPEAVLHNWQGIGIGLSGNLVQRLDVAHVSNSVYWFESDHIMMVIQIGIFGFFFYFGAIVTILRDIIRNMAMTTDKIEIRLYRASFISMVTLLIGGIFFPLAGSSRLVSFLVWFLCAASLSRARARKIHTDRKNLIYLYQVPRTVT